MSPCCCFVLPDVDHFATGGNVFNRHLRAQLGRRCEVQSMIWRAGVAPHLACTPEVWVVDSLLAADHACLDALARTAPGAKRVLVVHYLSLLEHEPPGNTAMKRSPAPLECFDGFITTSAYSTARLIDCGVERARVCTVRPGLEQAYLAPTRRRPTASPPRLLTVASLLPAKGLAELAQHLVAMSDLAWCWEIVGDPRLDRTFAGRFRDAIGHSPIADRIEVHGPLASSDLVRRYDAANVFVLPSRFESASMATMEAMARGLPVIAFDTGALPECLGSGGGGKLVPRGDFHALIAVLRALLTDPRKRAHYGRCARESSRAFPPWAQTAAGCYSFLQRLLNPAHAAAKTP